MNVRCFHQFGGGCKNDATWEMDNSSIPMLCDDCYPSVHIEGSQAKRVGPMPRVNINILNNRCISINALIH